MKRFSIPQWYSVTRAKSPRRFILVFLLLLNIVFFLLASACIYALSPDSIGRHGFFDCVYFAVTMVLDAGCISNLIADVGQTGVALIVVSLLIVVLGMILFTGAVIGYVTSAIGSYIDNSNAGKHRLYVSGHTVILNWNNRASEIINDLLYSDSREVAVILTSSGAQDILDEIEERLYDTIQTENSKVWEESDKMAVVPQMIYRAKHKLRRSRVSVIVREGDTFSTKLLNDIAVKQARAVIVLGTDVQNSACKFGMIEAQEAAEQGNTNLIKTLIQAADMTAAEDSADDQRLIAEIDDPWTMTLVDRVMVRKRHLGKNNIVPISADKILGQILSQFSLMPELSIIYEELFSNKGAAFFSRDGELFEDNTQSIQEYFSTHTHAVPLTWMPDDDGGYEYYYMAANERDIDLTTSEKIAPLSVKLNDKFWFSKRNVIILGHNSKCNAIMEGFNSFRNEWNFINEDDLAQFGPEILNITVIDDKRSLERRDYYRSYPYVNRIVEADIFDRDKIMATINEIVDGNEGDTSILILSDDNVVNDDIDSAALTYLIYVQDVVSQHMEIPGFDEACIDVIVEILNPKNHDVVQNYSRTNIVISNRYISKMITQISEKKAIFNFYRDILIYDEAGADSYTSMELYVKPVGEFFAEIPGECTAAQLIRGVFEAGPADNKSLVLGYVEHRGNMVIFSGDQNKYQVNLKPDDKIILFSNH